MSFEKIFEKMIVDEGGYQLTDIEGDNGGLTYAGISREMNPQWAGWAYIDRNEIPPSQLVRDFYRAGWWVPIHGDELQEDIAESIFNFAVNTSPFGRPTVAVKIAQVVAGVTPDGSVGPKTVAALNAMQPAAFRTAYTIGKIARYAGICNKNRSQVKFLLGWINRALEHA